MNKLFWALVMVFSLMITAWSGFFVYNELQPREPVAVPLTPVEPAPAEAVAPVATDTTTVTTAELVKPQETAAPETVPAAPVKPVKAKPVNLKEKQQIVFRYTQSSAKKVSVVGDFNKWFRQPMKHEGDEWKVAVKLAPGKYQYVFVVDDGKSGAAGKRVTDPNNQDTTKDGKLSILTVKPAQ